MFEKILKSGRIGKKPLHALIQFFAPEKKSIALALLFGLVKHSPLLLLPLITGNIITAITSAEDTALRRILWNSVVLIVLLAVNIPLHILFTKYMSRAIRNVEAALRSALVRRLQELSISFHDNFSAGRLNSKLLRDVEAIEFLARQVMNVMYFGLLNVVFGIIVALNRHLIIAVFFLLMAPIGSSLIYLFKNRVAIRNKDFRWTIESMSAMVSDMISMLYITRAHGLEQREIGKMDQQLHKVKESGIQVDTVNALFQSSTWVSFQLFSLLCLFFTGILALRGTIMVGDVVMYQGYFVQIISSISTLMATFPLISKGLESVQSLGEVLDSKEVETFEGKKTIAQLRGTISFDSVTYTYDGAHEPAVHDFTLSIASGECIAFVGESGSGKTTLMNMVLGFRQPTFGSIRVDGISIDNLHLRSFRQFLAVVPQQTVLFSGTVKENIIYGLPDVSDTRLWEVIDSANLRDVVTALPEGVNTQVGESGAKLSGGQRQRIAIARALIRDPRLIIFDEATSALDAASEKKVQDAIECLIQGRTTLIVAHRLSTIRNADRIVVMDKGHCVEVGPFGELLEAGGIFARLHALQV